MKIIDIDDETLRSLIDAPIDEKNVCSDALLDAIYDDMSYVENSHQSVGFVHDCATLITYGDAMAIYFSHPFSLVNSESVISGWRRTIIERLTGISIPETKESVHILDEENDLIYNIFCDKKQMVITFKYNEKYE